MKNGTDPKYRRWTSLLAMAMLGSLVFAAAPAVAQVQQAAPSGKQPNILVIMGDDVGWFNIGAYHRGMVSGKTPNPRQAGV